jgi:hypothetical protein
MDSPDPYRLRKFKKKPNMKFFIYYPHSSEKIRNLYGSQKILRLVVF